MRRSLQLFALLVFSSSILTLGAVGATPVAAIAPSPPNVVIIMTDDQRWDTVSSQ